jgi:fluoroquinolone transport system permease protein
VAGAARLELRAELRYGIALVALVMTAGWTAGLLAMPAWLSRGVGPYILMADTATFGAFFIAALFLYERGEGALAALTASPLRFGEYLGVKLTALTLLAVGSAVPVAVVAFRGVDGIGLVLLGVALVSVLVLALNFAVVTPYRSLMDFLIIAPIPLIPLMLAPLVHLAGLVTHPLLYLIPTVGAADLLQAPTTAPSPGRVAGIVAYLLLWIAGAVLLARQRFEREFRQAGRTGAVRVATPMRAWSRSGWLAAYARMDLRAVTRSAMLLLILVGPILLAAALRVGYPLLAGEVAARFGVELAAYRPLLLAALVVLHVPMLCGMVGALLVLDDIDDRTLLVLRVSPVTLQRYLAYRGAVVAGLAAGSLVIAAPLSGLASWSALPAMLPALGLAALQAPLIMLATAAYASNKVEGLALIKVIGGIVTGIAPAMWWLPDSADWLLRLLPPAWVLDALWRPSVPGLVGGVVVTGLVTALLARRTVRRLSGQ